MNTSRAFWEGSSEAWAKAVDKAMPHDVSFLISEALQSSIIVGGRFREGVAFRRKGIEEFSKSLSGINYYGTRYAMETKIAAEECAEHATKQMERLAATVKAFRDNTKNDIASMKASAERVATEVQKMEARYKQAAAILTSQEFERAIENAERFAAALDTISKLEKTQVHFEANIRKEIDQ